MEHGLAHGDSMIDLHNHILPGVDDGATDVDESIAIARQFASEGVVTVVATPHLDPLRGKGISALDVLQRVDALQSSLEQAGIDLRVLPGNELFLTPEAPELLVDGQASSLGASRSVLVEVNFDQRPLYLEDTLYRLQLAGYRPVLAHPERYGFIQRDVKMAAALVDKDVLLQVTAPSLLGVYGQKIRQVAEELLHRGLCVLASSDRHHPGSDRSLARLHERLTVLGGDDLADLLLRENPRRILADDDVIPPDPVPRAPSLFDRLLGRES